MKLIIKKYCSLLFLIAFLFPQIEQQLHAFEHSDDFHCTSSDKHFHEQEHVCSICDYIIPDKEETPVSDCLIINNFVIIKYHKANFIKQSENYFNNLSARAPPKA